MAKNNNNDKTKNRFVSRVQTCPYCKTKKMGDERFCSVCNLNFEDLEQNTIKDVRKYKKGGNIFYNYEGEIVLSPLLPDDISVGTLKMMTIAFGVFGLHNFYTGRTLRGIITFLLSLCTIGAYFFYDAMLKRGINAMPVLGYFAAITMFFWFFDLMGIFGKRYKFPCVLKTRVDVDRIFKAGKS